MTFFEKPKLRGGLASSEPTGAGDVYDAAVQSAYYVDNVNAREAALTEVYDRRIDAIFRATGTRLENPERIKMREPQWMDRQIHKLFGVNTLSPHEAFAVKLQDLTKQFPDQVDVIGAGRDPLEEARELARRSEGQARETLSRYRGSWGAGGLASLAGGLRGGLNDPANLYTMFAGPMGRVGMGVKSVLWMGVKQGAANAAVETAFQPSIASWRKEAGLHYDASTFAANVGGAALFGFGADVAVRGVARGVQRARGQVPVLDADGAVSGWQTPQEALDVAARKSKSELVRQAVDGDTKALRRLAQESGVIDDPELRAGFEHIADMEAADGRVDGVDLNEHETALTQAMRHIDDPDEPLPVPPQPVHRAVAGEIEPPDVLAARQQLNDGTVSVLEAAQIMRAVPQALDASVSLASGAMRNARHLARLSDSAFDRVAGGEADPAMAALVGALVPDKARHASVLDVLMTERPSSPAEARRMIGVLTREPRVREPLSGGMDNPLGVEGKAQVEGLERKFERDIADVSVADRAARLDDEIDGVSLARNLENASALTRMADLIGACKP